MRTTFLLIAIAGTLYSQARPYTYDVTRGPTAMFQGDTAWRTAYASSAINFSVTFTAGSNIINAPGNTFADGQGFYFTLDPAGGSTLPTSINPASPYTWCNVTPGATGRAVQYGLGTALGRNCAQSATGNYFTPFNVGDVGSGTNFISALSILHTPGAGTNVLLKVTHVPAGVTVGTVECDQGSLYVTCPLSGGFPSSANGRFPFIIPLIISPSATPGADTFEYTLECVTPNSTCTSINVVTPMEILAKAAIPVSHPSSIPALDPTDLSTWETRMATSANTYCTNKAAGTIFWGSGGCQSTPQVCSGAACWCQPWYYDGAWLYNQYAQYTGDPQWNNCANTIASFYADSLSNQQPSPGLQTFLLGFFFGPNRYCRTCSMKGRVAINRTKQYNFELGKHGQVWDLAIREGAYDLSFSVEWAVMNGYKDFADLQTRNPTAATQMLQSASRLRSNMMSQFGDIYMEMQTFMTGLCFESLIYYSEFNKDPVELDRTLQVVKFTLDYWDANMYNVVSGFPNEISWKRGDGYPGWLAGTPPNTPAPAGPYCSGNCRTERANEGLNYMILNGYWWFWWMTDEAHYMTQGDNIFHETVSYTMNTSGKEAGEKGKSLLAIFLRTQGIIPVP